MVGWSGLGGFGDGVDSPGGASPVHFDSRAAGKSRGEFWRKRDGGIPVEARSGPLAGAESGKGADWGVVGKAGSPVEDPGLAFGQVDDESGVRAMKDVVLLHGGKIRAGSIA